MIRRTVAKASSKKASKKKSAAKKKASKKKVSKKASVAPKKPSKKHLEGPAVFVQAYGAYNEGRILGEWIDAEDPDELRDGIDALMAKYPQYEEWGVFDHQMMPGFDGESVSRAIEWAETNAAFEEEAGYLDEDAKSAVMEYMADTRSDISEALEAFTGVSGDEEELGREYVESIGGLKDALGDKVANYFDYQSFARDMELSGDVVTMVTEDGDLLIAWSGDLEDEDDPEDPGWTTGFRSLDDYAEELLDDIGISPENAEVYFDWEKFGRDLSFDHSQYGGYWFRNM